MTQTNETEGNRRTSMRVPGRRGVGLQFREPPGVGGEGAETLPCSPCVPAPTSCDARLTTDADVVSVYGIIF